MQHFVTRPVPLEHYIFPAGGDGLHLVVDNKGRFRENNFQVTFLLFVLVVTSVMGGVYVAHGFIRNLRALVMMA